MRPAFRTGVWILAIVLLFGWSWMILGVAVFAIPDVYDPPESVMYSLMVFAVGIATPAVVVWMLRTQGVLVRAQPVRVYTLATDEPALELDEYRDASLPAPPAQLDEPLTDREVEVLQLVAGGKSNKEIAQELVISVGTVKTHTNNLYRKLGARNRTEAVAAGRRHGVL